MKKFQALMKSRFENAKKDNKGFSLVELIIAVVILGIIAVVAIGGLYGNVTKSRQNTDVSNAQSIQSALSTLSADKGFYKWATTEKTITFKWTDAVTKAAGGSLTGADITGTDEQLSDGTYKDKKISDAILEICPDGLPAAKAGGTFVLAIHGDGKGNVIVECRVYGSDHNLLEGEDSKQGTPKYATYSAPAPAPAPAG